MLYYYYTILYCTVLYCTILARSILAPLPAPSTPLLLSPLSWFLSTAPPRCPHLSAPAEWITEGF